MYRYLGRSRQIQTLPGVGLFFVNHATVFLPYFGLLHDFSLVQS